MHVLDLRACADVQSKKHFRKVAEAAELAPFGGRGFC